MARKKRGQGEGSIYQRTSGSWRVQIIIDGKRVGKTFKNKSDALSWLRKMQSQVEQGFDYFGSMIPLGEYLYQWLDAARTALRAIETNVKVVCQQLGYDQASMIEKLLIGNVAYCWLRLQWVEYQLAAFMSKSEVRFVEIEYWEKRLSASQRRYLRACETLARVRKITRATLQINIAEDGSQQVNIAGDLVNKDKYG